MFNNLSEDMQIQKLQWFAMEVLLWFNKEIKRNGVFWNKSQTMKDTAIKLHSLMQSNSWQLLWEFQPNRRNCSSGRRACAKPTLGYRKSGNPYLPLARARIAITAKLLHLPSPIDTTTYLESGGRNCIGPQGSTGTAAPPTARQSQKCHQRTW